MLGKGGGGSASSHWSGVRLMLMVLSRVEVAVGVG